MIVAPSRAPEVIAPPYLERLGLVRPPFADDADETFYFADPGLTERLDLLQHLSQFSDLLLAVTGERGAGKSTFVGQLLARGGESAHFCAVAAYDGMHPDVLLRQITQALARQTDTSDITDPLQALHAQLTAVQQGGRQAVFVIDDAHALPSEGLRRLLELQTGLAEAGTQLRLVLVGEPSLERMLGWKDSAGDHPNMYLTQLPPFSEEQTGAYLHFRLQLAGHSGPPLFTPPEVKRLHRASGGLPGALNGLAHHLLLHPDGRLSPAADKAAAALTPARPLTMAPSRGFPPPVILAAGAALVVGTIWLFGERIHAPSAPGAEPSTRNLGEPALQLAAATGETPAPALPPRWESAAQAVAVGAASLDAVAVLPQEPDPMPTRGTQPVVADAPTAVAASGTEETDVPGSGKPQAAHPVEPPVELPARHGPSVAGVDAPAEPPLRRLPSTATAPTRINGLKVQREEWLLAQDGGHYTLQLLGSRGEASIRRFIGSHRLSEPVAYFRTIREDREWYAVVQGAYPSFAAAKAAIRDLPASLRSEQPWIRSFEAVHRDIELGL
jgi:DamX protein